MESKGQITIYIIIGIVLVAAAALFFFLRGETEVSPYEREMQSIINEVPLEFQTIYGYVQTCLLSTSIDGLKLLGEQGGYIDMSSMRIAANPTDGTAVNLLTDLNTPIPYWYYLSSDNTCSKDCRFSFGYPKLRKQDGEPSIETQLEMYINDNLAVCLDDFSALEDQGYTISDQGDYVSEVNIAGDSVFVNIDYDLRAESGTASHEFTRFAAEVPIDLERIYNFARQLTEHEVQYNYLEKHVANLIVGYSGLDKELPPMADVTMEFGSETTWQEDQVKDAVATMMESNIPLLQVQNTRNYKPRLTESETKTALYNRGTLIPNNLDTKDLNVYYSYYKPPLGWDTYFDLNCKAGICRPMSISSNLVALIGIQRYKFFYDVSNPVLVEINAPNELKNFIPNGYRFKFFLESNLRDNAPLKEDYEQLVQLDLGASMFCDDDKRNSGDIALETRDEEGELLDDVSVVYTCGEESCVIGNTEDGRLVAKFPLCFGGVISFLKTDYAQFSLPFNVDLEESKELKVALSGIREKEIAVIKKMAVKSGENWVLQDTLVPLDPNEEVFITFEKIGSVTDQPYSAFVSLQGGAEDTISLSPGTYTVDATLLLTEKIRIPDIVEDGIEIKGMALNESPSGGLNLNITFTQEDLKKDKITMVMVGVDPRTFESIKDIEAIGLVDDLSAQNKEKLRPIIS